MTYKNYVQNDHYVLNKLYPKTRKKMLVFLFFTLAYAQYDYGYDYRSPDYGGDLYGNTW